MRSQESTPFFRLPRELRDQIYGYILGHDVSRTRDFKKSPCPVGACDVSLPTAFQSYIRLTHVSRQMAADVKGRFEPFFSDRISIPFWNLDQLYTALEIVSMDRDPEGLKNARFTLRCAVPRDSFDIPATKKKLMQDLRLPPTGGGQYVQTLTDRNHHEPCSCLDMSLADVEWRQTLYSPIRGSLLIWSWRKWYKRPLGVRPEEPRLQKWIVLEGRLRDLL